MAAETMHGRDGKDRDSLEPQSSTFIEMLENRWSMGNFVCVGLDSDYSRIPQSVKDANPKASDAIFEFNRAIIDATADFSCAFKPNAAFYEAQGVEGHNALVRTVTYIHENHSGIPVIYDAKRADIGSTNDGYIRSAFDEIGADAITINPYFGKEAIQPFLNRANKGVIVLVRTSNPGAGEFQDIEDEDGVPFYLRVAKKITTEWNANGNVALVVGATAPAELARVREAVGDIPFLIPGVGKQGGNAQDVVAAGMDSRTLGMMINSSRDIIFASSGEDFAQAARARAQELHDQINESRNMETKDGHIEGLTPAQEKLADMLFTTKTVAPVRRRIENPDGTYSFEKVSRPTSPVDFAQPGEFALKIHESHPDAPLSPIYVNLREMPEELVDQVGVVLAEHTAKDENKPDFCTGIPKAGVSLAKAYAKHSRIPHLEVFGKEEGSDGKRSIIAKPGIEGKGKSIRLIDDLATHGETKIEADEVAREMGFEVADVTVVVDRQQGAAQELQDAGITFRAAITIDQLLKYGVRKGNITKDQYEAIQAYFAANAS